MNNVETTTQQKGKEKSLSTFQKIKQIEHEFNNQTAEVEKEKKELQLIIEQFEEKKTEMEEQFISELSDEVEQII